ncbi:MAG: hypothetical protein JKY94_08520 [Rhodobacteraceae bacterium]|nr:hypothetical protein [Paracoccaceae bacterium]
MRNALTKEKIRSVDRKVRFVALRRAGAPLKLRQAILGHTQGGAIMHFNSGPEIELMQELILKSEPRQ